MNTLLAFVFCLGLMLIVFRTLGTVSTSLPNWLKVSLGIGAALVVLQVAIWLSPTNAALPVALAAIALATIELPEPGLRLFTDALRGSRLAVYLLSVTTLAGLILLYVPITTFLTSPGELAIHLDYLVTNNMAQAVGALYVAIAMYAIAITERLRTALTLLVLGTATLALVYAYALPFGYPMMTGLTFEQQPISAASGTVRLLTDAIVVVATTLGLSFVLRRYGGRPIVVGLFIVNLSLCIAVAADVHRERAGEAGGPHAGDALQDKPIRLSKTQPNVLIIFLDRFMGTYVEDILRAEPTLATRLSGFVWYPRTVSAGENSIAGLHPLLGGYDYLPVAMNTRDRPLRDLSVEAYSILPYNFAKRGFDVNFINPKGLGFTMAGDCQFLQFERVNCTHIPQSVAKKVADEMGFPLTDLAKSNYAELLSLLSAMRSAPYLTKEIILRRGPWRPYLDHSAGTTFREWAELRSWPAISATDSVVPTMNFISNILAHEPYYMGEDCKPQRDRFVVSQAEVRRRGHKSLFSLQHAIGARCVLLSVADYLDFLKAAGVYENTRIVIVSDHGIVGQVEDHSSRAVAGRTQANMYVRTRSVLLVKPRNAAGPLTISEEFMPNAAVPEIVCSEISGCVNPYLDNKPILTMGRDDPFYVSRVPWQFNEQNPRSFVIKEQYTLSGRDPFDAAGWKRVSSASTVN